MDRTFYRIIHPYKCHQFSIEKDATLHFVNQLKTYAETPTAFNCFVAIGPSG